MPCILKVRIIAGRGLPVMDRTSELTDPYVEIRFGDLEPQRTSIFRKSLNPVWNEDFRMEISDDAMLQDEPLELKIFDYDAITIDDSIGTVMLDLNPLLAEESSGQLSGWFPVFDTIKGMRGELNVQAKLQFFGDTNPFKESSAGVKFLNGNGLPSPYPKALIYGLVDVLITDVDPDYHWVDSFRSTRSSNEASQRMLQQLSCRLRREMGRKVLEMGGNVVFGFKESFDVEEYTRTVTIRGIGTAAFVFDPDEEEPPLNSPSSPTGSMDILTVSSLPSKCVLSIGGVVSARSVKLISEELKEDSTTEDNIRDVWLNELREDIRSHARLLNCNAVLNYRENVSIQGDIYFLSAEATACKLDYEPIIPKKKRDEEEVEELEEGEEEGSLVFPMMKKKRVCSAMHVPYRRQRMPFSIDVSLCRLCRRRYVPELLLATIDPPAELETAGETALVEAFVFKPLKKVGASALSSAIPFVEYDLHRQLLYKLRFKGYNAIFGLSYSISFNNQAIVAIASGTAVLLLGLPPPEPLKISRDLAVKDEEDRWIVEIQKRITMDAELNHGKVEKILDSFAHLIIDDEDSLSSTSDDESDSDTDSTGTSGSSERNLAVVQIDDETDEDLLLVLLDPTFPSNDSFLAGTLESPPPLELEVDNDVKNVKTVPQLITIFRKLRISPDERHLPFKLAEMFHSMYREAHVQGSLSFRSGSVLRTVRHNVSLSKEGDVHLFMTAILFGEMSKPSLAEEEGRLEREEEWEELISLDVSTSSDDSDYDDRIFSRRRRRSIETEDSIDEHDPIRNTVTSPGGKIQKFLIAGHMNHVELTPAASIPASAIVSHYGSISLKLFKEVHLSEVAGGSPAIFSQDFLMEAFAILRAHVIALGGNALVNLQLKPSAFLENYKSQFHAILHLSGDALEVELDEPDAWSMLAHKAFYPDQA